MPTKDFFKGLIEKHWIGMVIGLVSASVAYGGLVYRQCEIQKITEKNAMGLEAHGTQITAIEKTTIELHAQDQMAMQKLEGIQVGIKDLKETVEKMDIKMNDRMTKMNDRNQVQFDEIKKILYKPVIGTTYLHDDNEIASKVERLINK